jgi:signal transduction histidine kinase
MYAFATVPDRGLKVIVGVDRASAMRESSAWEQDALVFAAAISILLGVLAWLLLRALDAARQRHEALAHERSILEATLTGMSDGIMMVDADLRLVAWNQHFSQYTGVPPDILRVGLPMEDILRSQVAGGEFGPVDADTEVARRLALLHSGGSMGTTERSRPGGRQLEMRRNPLPGGGFVTLYRDVTARREAEERLRQAQTMAAIGRLTAGVAHDFNNLLISISGNAEMLHHQLQGDPVHARRLSVILQSAGRGADLVRRLLAFARKQSLTPMQVDLNKLVRGMGDLLRATLGRAIRMETRLDDTLWSALVDPVQIEHVILNLAINARDAMPDGGTLTISTTNTSLGPNASVAADLPAGDYVIVAVSDTGTGMSEEVLRNAFEPFFTTKPIGEGSGLGLSQVYGVANQSGGGVRIDSTVGAGTTVSVLFPRAPDDVSAQPVPPSSLEQAAASVAPRIAREAQNRTILVVDDESDCRETIAATLSANGFAVILAENGEAALQLIDDGAAFDLLLVDYGMPGMNGATLAAAARRRRLAVPVVFVTGDGQWVNGERWVLTKPFLTRNLIAMLQNALGMPPQDDAVRQATSQAM